MELWFLVQSAQGREREVFVFWILLFTAQSASPRALTSSPFQAVLPAWAVCGHATAPSSKRRGMGNLVKPNVPGEESLLRGEEEPVAF